MAKSNRPVSLARILADKRQAMRSARESLRVLENNADGIRAVLALAAPIARHLEEGLHPSVYAYTWGQIDLNLHGNIDVETMKCPKLASVLETCLTVADAAHTNDYANENHASRDFVFTREIALPSGFALRLRVVICATLKGDGATCRRVLVGTRMVEEKQYAIKCE